MSIKIVDFHKWCERCEHGDKPESDDPCWDCLNEPANEDSTKPLYFKEKEGAE